MDEDLFGDSTQTNTQQQSNGFAATYQQNQQDQFQFVPQPQYNLSNQQIPPTQFDIQQANEANKRMHQQQDKIQLQLREKANKEYEEKQKRKQNGRVQLEEFNHKKEQQIQDRKLENIQKEKKIIANNKKLTEEAGWNKVAANVSLKQSQSTGKKDINRMREAIINKKNDGTNI